MALSFKDVGIRRDSIQQNPVVTNKSQIPIGVKTPLQLDNSGNGLFVMNMTVREQIQDNLKNLIKTNHGDRVINFDFGANLLELVTEYSNKDDFDTEAMIRINTAITKYMPFVSPVEFESSINRENSGQGTANVVVNVIYSVPALNIVRDKIEVNLFVI